jgi:hypothetical protein
MDIVAEKEIDHHTRDDKGDCTVEPHTSYHPLKKPPDPDNSDSEEALQEIGGRFSPREWLDRRRKSKLWALQVRNSGVQGPNDSENAEARVKRSRYLPCHYFDYMGGTSTGG